MNLSIAEQIILHSTSDKQAVQKADLLCYSKKEYNITRSIWYYFKDESFINTRWDDHEAKWVIVEVMEGDTTNE